MKLPHRIALIFFFLLVVANCADFYFSAASRVATVPRSVMIDFYDEHGVFWHRYYLSHVIHRPVIYKDLPDDKKRLAGDFFNRIFDREYGKSLLGSLIRGSGCVYSSYLSQLLLSKKSRRSLYLTSKFREIRNAFLMKLFYSDDEIIQSLLNNKDVTGGITGTGAVAWEAYGREFGALDGRELSGIMEFVYSKHRTWYKSLTVREAVRIREKLQIPARNNYNRIDFGGSYRDYCIKALQGEGLLEGKESMKVFTSMNPAMQKALEKYVVEYIVNLKEQDETRRHILKGLDPIEAAVIVADTKTGAVKAMIGSIRYSGKSLLNRAVQSRRQVSSTFKPFLYTLAMETGDLGPDTVFEDKPVILKNRDGSPWEPKNFYPYFIGKVTLREGLVISINTVAVQLIQLTGVDRMTGKAREIFAMPGNDIGKRILPEPSLSLGSIDLTPLEVAKGYLMLANGGEETFPFPVRRVLSGSGDKPVYEKQTGASGKRVFSKEAVEKIKGILGDVVARGTASTFIKEPFKFPVGGKSGSSPSDSWFVGYSDDLLIVTWAGYDIPRSSLKGRLPEFIVIPFWYRLMSAFQGVK